MSMPAKELMLQPEADWTPTEWAKSEIQAVIGVKGAAELKQGINLCLIHFGMDLTLLL